MHCFFLCAHFHVHVRQRTQIKEPTAKCRKPTSQMHRVPAIFGVQPSCSHLMSCRNKNNNNQDFSFFGERGNKEMKVVYQTYLRGRGNQRLNKRSMSIRCPKMQSTNTPYFTMSGNKRTQQTPPFLNSSLFPLNPNLVCYPLSKARIQAKHQSSRKSHGRCTIYFVVVRK